MHNIILFLSALRRRYKVFVQAIADASVIVMSFFAAMALRLENLAFLGNSEIWLEAFIAASAAVVGLYFAGIYRVVVRFITGKILFAVAKGVILAGLVIYLSGLAIGASIPRSVPLIFVVFSFLSVGGVRFFARTIFRSPVHPNKRPVIIYGAGEGGLQLVNSLFHGRHYIPIALVDDNPALQGMSVGGLRVYAPDQIPGLVESIGVQVVLLAVPSMERSQRRRIVEGLEDLGVEIKTIPGLNEIISGRAKISELRAVSPEDLLGRDPVAPNPELLGKNITGRSVMVTGAGGSIGSELCRQILSQNPKTLVLFEVSEFALYTIEAELSEIAARFSYATKIVPVLGSIQCQRRLASAITAFGVNTLYHAAAYKHVPLVEENVIEGIRNNVLGTLSVVKAAKEHGVEKFIMISTDKAVRPTNVMGATKRLAELICQAHATEKPSTVFSMVRFGNVLGSSGSVIPRFRAQIESGGPVTVTHKDITRYFMTIPEAAQLVIQAGAMGCGGDVFVLDMGEPVKIMELAKGMIKLHGLKPYVVDHLDQVVPEEGDIAIWVTGLRRGEKLYEELLIGNKPSPTSHPRIMTASEASLSINELTPILDRLLMACEEVDLQKILNILHELPLEYRPVGDGVSYSGGGGAALTSNASKTKEAAQA